MAGAFLAMPEAISFEAKFYALRKSKDGLVVSFVIHPNDAPNELITAPIGEQYIVALAPFVESPSVEATNEKGSEGSQLRPAAGRVLSSAERAIINAHKYADGNKEILDDIHRYCGVPTCADFKTDPKALARFHDWEYINGYVQGRP